MEREKQEKMLPLGSWSISEKEKKAEEEEYDYVVGHCKLNYLNVRTVIMAKGVKIKRRGSQRLNQNERERNAGCMLQIFLRARILTLSGR